MNTQRLKLFGLSLLLAATPVLATTASAQWAQQGQAVSMRLGDSASQTSVLSNATTPVATHTISLGQNGVLQGTVVSLDANSRSAAGLGGTNVFFVRNGQVIQQAQTTADGSFSVNGLSQGAYSFYAAGKNAVAAYGVYVSAQPNSTQNILSATTGSANYHGLKQMIQRNAPAQVAQSVQSALHTTQGAAAPAPQIRLIGSKLYGQVSSLFANSQTVGGLQVILLQNDQPVAQVQTDASGVFNIPDVDAGVYDYVVGGSNGFAAGRFEAVGQTGPMTQVSYRKTITQLDCCLTCPDQQVASQPVEMTFGQDAFMEPSYGNTVSAPIEYAGESIGYGGASGGCGGCANNFSSFSGGGVVRGRFGGLGSRFSGGGAGLGRLITLGALGGGILAIADDDSDSMTPSDN